MSRRTLTLSTLTAKLSRKKGYFVLDNILDKDLLDVAVELANTALPEDLGIEARRWFCSVANVTVFQRACLIEFESGNYGEERRVVDVPTGMSTYKGTKDDSHLVNTRILLVVPPGETVAYLVNERDGLEGGGARFRTLLHEKIVGLGPGTDDEGAARDVVASFTSVTRGEDWLASAELRSIEAIREEAHLDPSDGEEPVLDTVRYREVVEPIGSEGWLPPGLFRNLRGMDAVEAASYLHFRDPEEVDEVVVTASDGKNKKSFALGREKSPGLRLVIKDHEEDAPDDRRLVELAEGLIGPHLKDIYGIDWQSSWVRP